MQTDKEKIRSNKINKNKMVWTHKYKEWGGNYNDEYELEASIFQAKGISKIRWKNLI